MGSNPTPRAQLKSMWGYIHIPNWLVLPTVTYNILIIVAMKVTAMPRCVNPHTILILVLILTSVSLLGNIRVVNAYTRVDDTSSGRGTVTCPTGEQHEGAISISSTSIPSMSGYYDIDIATNGSGAIKSGVFDYVKITNSGEFTLKGKETRDDICGGLTGVGSIPIEITGQCVFNPTIEPPTIIKFRASNGEKADVPSSPTCS